MFGHLHRDFLGDAAMARVHQPNGIDQLRPEHAFQEIPGSSRLEPAQSLYISSVGGQDNDASSGPLLANGCDRVDSVGLGHAEIHQRDVGPVHAKQGDRLVPISRLSHHGHVGLRHNCARYPTPQERMIVYRKHSDWLLVTHDRPPSRAVPRLLCPIRAQRGGSFLGEKPRLNHLHRLHPSRTAINAQRAPGAGGARSPALNPSAGEWAILSLCRRLRESLLRASPEYSLVAYLTPLKRVASLAPFSRLSGRKEMVRVCAMQRLFSMFPTGAAGIALALLRLTVAAMLLMIAFPRGDIILSQWAFA